jgi:predicted lipid-binding transport protein (Tim44 family)
MKLRKKVRGGSMPFPYRRKTLAVLASVIAIGFAVSTVDAKPGRSGSSGNRGARTDTSVPSTPTAPRTTTGAPSSPAAVPGRPAAPNAAAAAANAAKPSMMSTMAKGFAMGLIGAGLFGLLTGNGLFGGLSGLMGFLGLLLQVALIAIVIRLVWGFIKNRQQKPAMAGGPDLARAGIPPQMAGGVAGGAAAAAQPASYQPQPVEPQRADNVGIGPDDYNAFQGVLTDLMGAYSNEDIAGIRRVTTPDVAAHFIRELHENQQRGTVNRLGQPQLLQGDLAEAWYEDSAAYATVAMRFAMTDVTLNRTTGQVVAGNPQQPEESVEIWTFRREGAGRPWVLCGQQQG